MKGFLAGLSKLILGVAIALMLLSLAGVATARYFMGRLSVLPPKPVFENDAPAQPAASETETAPTNPSPPPEAAPPEPAPTPDAPEAEIQPGLYQAIVVQPIGLVIREGPGTSYGQLGGVDYNDKVEVLEEDTNQNWIRIRVIGSGQEGWVKAGNTRQVQ
jgi:uncharacterized protein YgiM (DUF1202 family)